MADASHCKPDSGHFFGRCSDAGGGDYLDALGNSDLFDAVFAGIVVDCGICPRMYRTELPDVTVVTAGRNPLDRYDESAPDRWPDLGRRVSYRPDQSVAWIYSRLLGL